MAAILSWPQWVQVYIAPGLTTTDKRKYKTRGLYNNYIYYSNTRDNIKYVYKNINISHEENKALNEDHGQPHTRWNSAFINTLWATLH